MSHCLELLLAEDQIDAFVVDHDQVMRDHFAATDCHNCETFLKHGIDAHRLLVGAEATLRLADSKGLIDNFAELHSVIARLYQRWVEQCDFAEKWISRVEQNGYVVETLNEFRNCCEAVRDWLETNEWMSIARKASDANYEEDSCPEVQSEEKSTD